MTPAHEQPGGLRDTTLFTSSVLPYILFHLSKPVLSKYDLTASFSLPPVVAVCAVRLQCSMPCVRDEPYAELGA